MNEFENDVRTLCEELRSDPRLSPRLRPQICSSVMEEGFWRYVEMLDVLRDVKGRRVLSVGVNCGIPEIILKRRNSCEVYAADRESKLDTWCWFAVKHGIEVRPVELGHTSLPYADEEFDMVIFAEVLEHLRCSPLLALKELRRVLRKGGRLFLTTPNAASWHYAARILKGQNLFAPVSSDFTPEMAQAGKHITDSWSHVREWTAPELRELVKAADLKLIYARYGRCYNLWRFVRITSPGALAGWLVTMLAPRLRGQIYLMAERPA